jgi:uncharacterized membrane protein YraQ (UPF0718 family)
MQDTRQTKKNKGVGGWIFLAVVLLIYAFTAFLDSELANRAISDFRHLMVKVLPILLIVFFLIFMVNLLLQPAWVKKYLGHRSGITGWLAAIIGGVLSTGPVYPWYALIRDLREKGMKTALAAVFLYSRSIKLPLLPMLVHYFGMSYMLILSGYLILFSIVSGMLMERMLGTPATPAGQLKKGD